ncbi:MAG: hypothetical protein AAF958_09990 [Planctomycetota bacterium]
MNGFGQSASPTNAGASKASPGASQADTPAAATRQNLLQQILAETVRRRPEDTDSIEAGLADWIRQRNRDSWDRVECEHLIDRMLWQLFGEQSEALPPKLSRDIASTLWRDPRSRGRLRRFHERLRGIVVPVPHEPVPHEDGNGIGGQHTGENSNRSRSDP